MNHLKVSTRLALSTGVLALLILVVGLLGLYGIRAGNEALKTVYDDRVVPLGQLARIQHLESAGMRLLDDALNEKTAQAFDAAAATLEANTKATEEIWVAYMATYLTPEESVLARQLAGAKERYVREGIAPTVAALRSHDAARVQQALHGALDPAAEPMLASLEKLKELQIDVARQVYQAAIDRYRTLIALTAAVVGLGLACALWLGWSLTRSLTRQLGTEPATAAALAHAVAAGDLTVPIALRAGDDTSLMAALQQMRDSLQRTVALVRRDADSVATASAEIAQGTHDLSQRTEEQASALQQTAASMEQLGTTVRQNAETAHTARQLAVGAADVAQQGGRVVQEVVQTMKGIEDSSRRIGEIISVIDGIAFQTNILALNAAGEAARAGEPGRGFAVVAGEVRTLAQRSAEAAKEVKSLINDSAERVEAGTQRVGQAGATMEEVVGAIGRVRDLVSEISSASAEQSHGVAQIGEAVTQMDQVTQQNAALVEQSSAAAESLRAQSAHLLQAVSVFRLPDGAAAQPAATGWSGGERRGPNRATNVVRPTFQTQAARPRVERDAPARTTRTGTDDWADF